MDVVTDLDLGTFVEQQHAWFEDTPQFRPAFEGSSDLEPVCQHYHGGVLQGTQQFPRHSLLLPTVLLPLILIRLLAGKRGALQKERDGRKNGIIFWMVAYNFSLNFPFKITCNFFDNKKSHSRICTSVIITRRS